MIQKILFCTDGSSYAQEALKYTAWVANATQAKVTALYVSDLRRFEMPTIMDVGGSLGIQPYQSLISAMQDAEKQKADLIEEFSRKGFKDAGLSGEIEFQTTTGLLTDTIEEIEEDFDLVVMGKRGESAEHAIDHIGSTLERVVRKSVRPCLVTNRKFREVKSVAFAFDNGSSCEKILAFLEKSNWLKELPLHLLSVIEEREDDQNMAGSVKAAEQRLQQAGYTVRTEMLGGIAEDAIAEYVEKGDIDLLLMGAYGHTRIRRFLIGSTTTEMLRRCKIPVLCVH